MTEFQALQIAEAVASQSKCAKSKRGVIIWDASGILSCGSNSPPPGFVCDGSDACRASCGKVAVHAEQRALLKALSSVVGAEMLHTKVNEYGRAVPGGPPSCSDCSKLIVEAGIARMWLYETVDGTPTLVRYTAEEFHSKTLLNCGLHHSKELHNAR